MREFDPLQDGISRIELIGSMGNDLSIVNDAKASFERVATEFGEKEEKLLRYLLTANPPHTSPLRGVVFKFKIKAPLYIARQWYKSVIASNHNDEQLGWNEKSFRYTEAHDPNEFYIPGEFRLQSTSNRQSSEGSLIDGEAYKAKLICKAAVTYSYQAYQNLLELGVCREQARGFLVPSIYTSWVWTASLQAVLNFLSLRLGNGAQSEITSYATAIAEIVKEVCPYTMRVWEEMREQ